MKPISPRKFDMGERARSASSARCHLLDAKQIAHCDAASARFTNGELSRKMAVHGRWAGNSDPLLAHRPGSPTKSRHWLRNGCERRKHFGAASDAIEPDD